MTRNSQKMSDIMKQMAEQLLRHPEAAHSCEAATAIVFSGVTEANRFVPGNVGEHQCDMRGRLTRSCPVNVTKSTRLGQAVERPWLSTN